MTIRARGVLCLPVLYFSQVDRHGLAGGEMIADKLRTAYRSSLLVIHRSKDLARVKTICEICLSSIASGTAALTLIRVQLKLQRYRAPRPPRAPHIVLQLRCDLVELEHDLVLLTDGVEGSVK